MSCGGCRKRSGQPGAAPTPLVRWLGVTWYGVPAPLRWLMGKQMSQGLKGCGCVVVLKTLYEQERVIWRNVFALMVG